MKVTSFRGKMSLLLNKACYTEKAMQKQVTFQAIPTNIVYSGVQNLAKENACFNELNKN